MKETLLQNNYRQLASLLYQNSCNAFQNIQQNLVGVNKKDIAHLVNSGSVSCIFRNNSISIIACSLKSYLVQHMASSNEVWQYSASISIYHSADTHATMFWNCK